MALSSFRVGDVRDKRLTGLETFPALVTIERAVRETSMAEEVFILRVPFPAR